MPTYANTIDGNEILAKRSQCDYAGNDIQTTYATKTEVTTGLAGKENTISDLAAIRSGAQAGSTAVQPGDLAAVATTGAYSDLTGAPTIPTATSDLTNDSGFITLSDIPAQVNADWNSSSGVSEILNKPTIPSGTQLVPAATSTDADKVLTVDAQGTPVWENAQAPISSGNGIDITNNVVSAKVDGTTITTNGSGELAVVNGGQSTASSFFTPAYGKSADGSLSTPRLGPSLHTRYYSFNSHGLALENSYVNSSISVLGRRPDVRLANFIQPNGNIIFMYGASTWNASWYPVWFPCNHRYDSAGYINVIDPTVYLKAKSPVTFTDQSTEGQYIYNSDGTYNTHFNTSNRYSFSVKAPLSTGYNVDTDTYDMIGDWTSITTPPLDEWVLTFWDGNNNTWKNIGGATEADSRLAVKWNTSSLDVKVMSGGGLDVNTGAGIYVTNPLPTSSSSDEGKVLTVNSSGSAEWVTLAAGGVTDVEVNGTSVVNASGVAEVTVPSGAQLVPAATSSDADKVLTVDSLGVPGWAVVPAQSTGLFQAEYGTTSYTDIKQAINDKKIVYCRLNSGASRMAFLAYIGSNNFEFQYYRSNSSASGTDSVFVYKVDSSNAWTTTERTVKAGNIDYPVTDVEVDGASVVSGGVASITMPTGVPSYTTTEDGKVLGVVNNQGTAELEWMAQSGGGTQADWTEDDPTDPSYIENKPTPKTLTAGTGISITENSSTITITNTAGAASVTDVLVDGSSVVTNGVANITTPTVDQTYNAVSTNAQSGVAVADAIGNLPTNLTAAQIQALKEALGCDETVLWEGSAASSFTVSETIANFEYLRVRMNYNGMDTWCYGTIVSSAQFTIACIGYANNSGDLNRLQMFGGSFTSSNGLAFTSEAGKCIYFANASAAIGGGTTGACNIKKIVGIHRIASNTPHPEPDPLDDELV